jgi:hypothetical protein
VLPAATLAALVTLGSGCARRPVLSVDALPVERVVVYRNGVAYFERAGHIEEDQVRFKMRPAEVGDFLATLAVIERGGSSVRAAAFPLQDESDSVEAAPKPLPAPGSDEAKGLKVVVLSLDGKAHDLRVGYVAESPVWRPSYRLVVRANGEADLQAWGIVENLSGEDWKDVALSLVAGAPLAFRAELGTPVIPSRPVVTDEGEIIAAVPHAETSLRQEEPPPPPPAEAPAPAPAKAPAATAALHAMGRATPKSALKKGTARDPPEESATSEDSRDDDGPSGAEPSPPRSLGSLAAVAAIAGSTRYDLPVRVTIPDRSATMVLLLSRRVPGEALFLFAPDGGVPDSASHPFRVARFSNATPGALERGPIAVFEDGSFLGQGMVDPLPQGATATVPFALERIIAVDRDQKVDEADARIAKIENSELTIERDSVTQTTYRIRNGGQERAKVLIKHGRIGGSRLFAPPPGTEDNVGTGTALVPATVLAHATADVLVDERVSVRLGVDWFQPLADRAVSDFLADRARVSSGDRDLVQKLGVAWAFRAQIQKATDERNKLAKEGTTLGRASEETRRNLGAIEKNKTAEGLRQKLTARLAETAARLDDVNRRTVELDAKLAELHVQFSEAVRDLKWTAPPRPAPGAPPPAP